MNIMLFNETGLGNTFLALPILLHLHRIYSGAIFNVPFSELYSKDIALLPDSLELRHFPRRWRRFKKKYHERIYKYIESKDVTMVINLRNECDSEDADYFLFRSLLEREKNTVLCIDWHTIKQTLKSCYIHYIWREVFINNNLLEINYIEPYKKMVPEKIKSDAMITIYIGSSRPAKRLSIDAIIYLVETIVRNGNPVRLISGVNTEEKEEAKDIFRAISRDIINQVTICAGESVINLVNLISGGFVKLVISPDTFFMHLSYLCQLPTIGYFLTTSADVWGPSSYENFKAIESPVCKKCSMMPNQGTCMEYLFNGCQKEINEFGIVESIVREVDKLVFNTN